MNKKLMVKSNREGASIALEALKDRLIREEESKTSYMTIKYPIKLINEALAELNKKI